MTLDPLIEQLHPNQRVFEQYTVRRAITDELTHRDRRRTGVSLMIILGVIITAVLGGLVGHDDLGVLYFTTLVAMTLPSVYVIALVYDAHERFKEVRLMRHRYRAQHMKTVLTSLPNSGGKLPLRMRVSVAFDVHMRRYSGKIAAIFGICTPLVLSCVGCSLFFKHFSGPDFAPEVCLIIGGCFGVLGLALLGFHVLGFMFNVCFPDHAQTQQIDTELRIRHVKMVGEDSSGGLSLGVDTVGGELSVHDVSDQP